MLGCEGWAGCSSLGQKTPGTGQAWGEGAFWSGEAAGGQSEGSAQQAAARTGQELRDRPREPSLRSRWPEGSEEERVCSPGQEPAEQEASRQRTESGPAPPRAGSVTPAPTCSARTRRRAESESHEFTCLKAHGKLRSPARVKGFHSAPQSASAPPTPTLLFGFSFCR